MSYPELVPVYEAMHKEGTYDLAHPVCYDEAMSLLIIKRREEGWNP